MTDDPLANRMPWTHAEQHIERLITREWLVTNGRGGYGAMSVSGACTRRHHGLLIAALPEPLGRVVMLTHLCEELRVRSAKDRWAEIVQLGGEEIVGEGLCLNGSKLLTEFRLEMGLPTWRYEFEDHVLEKQVVMPFTQNTTFVTWRLLEGPDTIRLRLRPSLRFRPHNGRVDEPTAETYRLGVEGRRIEIMGPGPYPPLRMKIHGDHVLVLNGGGWRSFEYRLEAVRGYDHEAPLWSPGYIRAEIEPGGALTLVASTESWEIVESQAPEAARKAELERRRQLLRRAGGRIEDQMGGELVLAADQFIISPSGRAEDSARARAVGTQARSVIAGYPWFTDWGRDTMISLEGLTLTTGREEEAQAILRTFALHVRDGLIPNLFPEGEHEGLYHTADATMWFFHAVDRYLAHTDDWMTLEALMPQLREIIEAHKRGTRFNIGVDPKDGLITQGEEGYQLTWMDAKVDGWVVTPRRGKPVEINALWYNALKRMERWARELSDHAWSRDCGELAARVQQSFNQRFWNDEAGCLFDVVDGPDGDDPAIRPNQVFSISLPSPVLDRSRWEPVMAVVERQLLTPVGLRSLSRGHPYYKPTYEGDLRTRDAAYHQGTVWGWLIGPYVDAWSKLHPGNPRGARKLLLGFVEHMGEACIGSISEIFDAEPPYAPRGCFAQAWSVAEVLRCWAMTAR